MITFFKFLKTFTCPVFVHFQKIRRLFLCNFIYLLFTPIIPPKIPNTIPNIIIIIELIFKENC